MGHNKSVRRRFNRVFKERNISLFTHSPVTQVSKDALTVNEQDRAQERLSTSGNNTPAAVSLSPKRSNPRRRATSESDADIFDSP